MIIVDRFYTSVAHLLRLLSTKMYASGTIRANRIGYCMGVAT